MLQLVSNKPQFNTKVGSVKDVLKMKQFNAMYEADAVDSSANNCNDASLGTAFIKFVKHNLIKIGGSPVDINFFENAFGYKPVHVDAKFVYNRYRGDIDYNIYVENDVADVAMANPWIAILRTNHSSRGTVSYPEIGYSILDKETQTWYEIINKDVTQDFRHRVQVRAYRADTIPSFKKGKKYLVFPARIVGGNSCAVPVNNIETLGWVQKVAPFRLRSDWRVEIDLKRGYTNVFRFVVMFDAKGNKIDSWDTYEQQKSREKLQLARNLVAFLGTPITNADITTNVGASVDSTHVGFYGMLPQMRYGGGQVIDFDPAVGFDLESDLQPFMLTQDALKKCSRFMVKHGKEWKANIIDRTNKMVKRNTGNEMFPAYSRAGETIKKLEISAWEYLGFKLDMQEWGSLSDSRLLGGSYFSNLAMALAMEGAVDENNSPVDPLEFYQYGQSETGDYYESTVDERQISLCEELKGYCAESVMMAFHGPENHALFNPVTGA